MNILWHPHKNVFNSIKSHVNLTRVCVAHGINLWSTAHPPLLVKRESFHIFHIFVYMRRNFCILTHVDVLWKSIEKLFAPLSLGCCYRNFVTNIRMTNNIIAWLLLMRRVTLVVELFLVKSYFLTNFVRKRQEGKILHAKIRFAKSFDDRKLIFRMHLTVRIM